MYLAGVCIAKRIVFHFLSATCLGIGAPEFTQLEIAEKRCYSWPLAS